MFGDLDCPLNASRGLSVIAEFLVYAKFPTDRQTPDKAYTVVGGNDGE